MHSKPFFTWSQRCKKSGDCSLTSLVQWPLGEVPCSAYCDALWDAMMPRETMDPHKLETCWSLIGKPASDRPRNSRCRRSLYGTPFYTNQRQFSGIHSHPRIMTDQWEFWQLADGPGSLRNLVVCHKCILRARCNFFRSKYLSLKATGVDRSRCNPSRLR